MVGFLAVVLLIDMLCYLQCLEVIPTKPEILYVNTKYFKLLKVEVKRHDRKSPYYINAYVDIYSAFGDNMTFSFDTYENIQGHYVPLLFKMEHELCKFFKEPIVGQMIIGQMPKNLTTCPIPAGYYVLPDVLVHLENLPAKLPFTFEAVEIRARVDIKGHVTKTKEPLFSVALHVRLIQKPKNIKI